MLEGMSSVIQKELLEKCNIGPDGKMQINPEMQEALGLSDVNLEAEGRYTCDGIAYEEISLSQVEKRPISDMEYEALPDYSKKGTKQLVKPGYMFAIAVLLIMGYKTIGIVGISASTFVGIVLVLALFIAVGIGTTFARLNHGIAPGSEVAEGTVLFFDNKNVMREGNHIHYYLTVAFNDTKQYVKRVECDQKTFKRIKISSKVYICNGKAYAAE